METNSVFSKISNFCVEAWTYFMIGIKNQVALVILNVLFSMAIPFGILLMVSMMPVEITKEVAIVFISGNLITSISNLCISSLAQLLIGTRVKNGFEHMATLPIFRGSPIVGIFLSSAISTIPALIIMPIVGVFMLNTTFSMSGWLILVIIISIITMTGIGTIIGTFSENYDLSNAIAMIMMFFVMFGTPVYYAIESLPSVMRIFQKLLPFSYSLEAMRSLMENPVLTQSVMIDILILTAFMILSLVLASRFCAWRQRK